MSGGERGRRNTGYWAPFNLWWRAHLEKHGERPKAEDLKRWFREESRHAFPNEAPTYTMIRNHAKGLRDIASVKHYFRDYRARKRRAVADLAGEPSPRSEPEEEDNSGTATGSPSDDACTSDDDWQSDPKKRRQDRERRKKRSQQDGRPQQPVQQLQTPAGAAGTGTGAQQQPSQQRDPGATPLEEQGDLTVTVTVTPPAKQQHDAARCGPRHDSQPSPRTSAASLGSSRASPPHSSGHVAQHPHEQHQHIMDQQRQQRLDHPRQHHEQLQHSGSGGRGNVVASTHRPSSGGGAASAAIAAASPPVSFAPCRESDWRGASHTYMTHMTPMQGQSSTAAAALGGYALDGAASPGLISQQQNPPQLPRQQQDPSYNCGLGLGATATEHGPRLSAGCHSHNRDAQGMMHMLLFGPTERATGAAEEAGGPLGGACRSWAPCGPYAPAATTGGLPPPAAAGPAVGLVGTHLSPMSSQPVPPADAASTASTEVHHGHGSVGGSGRAVAAISANLAAADHIRFEMGYAGGDGSGGQGAAAAMAAAAPGPSTVTATDVSTFVKGEDLYVGLHGSAGRADRADGAPYGLSLRPPSAMAAGSLGQQPWTPFAIPMTAVGEVAGSDSETRPPHSGGGAVARTPVKGGSCGSSGQGFPTAPSSFALWRVGDERGEPLAAMASDAAAALADGGSGGGRDLLLRSAPASAPVPGDSDAGTAGLHLPPWRQYQHLAGPGRPNCQDNGGGLSWGSDMPTRGNGGGTVGFQLQSGPVGLSPLSVASSRVNDVSRQASLPVSVLCGGGGGDSVDQCFLATGDAMAASLQPTSSAVRASGPPPVTTGFAPSKSALRTGAAAASAPGAGGGGGAAASAAALQVSSPGSGQLPTPGSGHVVLTGVGSPRATAAAVSLVHPSNSCGTNVAAASGAATAVCPSVGPTAAAAEAAVLEMGAGSGGVTPRSALLPGSSPQGAPVPAGPWSDEPSTGALSAALWSPLCPQTKAAPPAAVGPYPGPYPPAMSPAAASTVATSSPSPTRVGGMPPGVATGSANGRVRWLPYVPHPRAGQPPPWYPYAYPAGPHLTTSPRAAGYPVSPYMPYMPYMRPLARRRYTSAPSSAQGLSLLPLVPPHLGAQVAHLPPPPQEQGQHLQGLQQQQQMSSQQLQLRQTLNGRLHSVGMGGAWPGGGRAGPVVEAGGRAPASPFGIPCPDPWASGEYDHAGSPRVLAASGSASVPRPGDGDPRSLAAANSMAHASDGYGHGPGLAPQPQLVNVAQGVHVPDMGAHRSMSLPPPPQHHLNSFAPGAPLALDSVGGSGEENILERLLGICMAEEDDGMPLVLVDPVDGGVVGGGENGGGGGPWQPGGLGPPSGPPGLEVQVVDAGMMMGGGYGQADGRGAGMYQREQF